MLLFLPIVLRICTTNISYEHNIEHNRCKFMSTAAVLINLHLRIMLNVIIFVLRNTGLSVKIRLFYQSIYSFVKILIW